MRLLAFGINYFLSLILAIGPLTPARNITPATLPVRIDGFGVEMSALPEISPDNIEPLLQQVEASGAGYIRQEIDWSLVETSPDVYDWSAVLPLDQLFTAAVAHDLKVVAVLSGGPTYLAAGGEPIDEAALRDRWQKFVNAAVEHFGESINIWEIGSAVNSSYALTPFLSPLSPENPIGPDPVLYTKLLRAAAKTIRNADPNDQVWLGSLTGFSASSCAMNPLTFMLEVHAARGWNSIDAVPYRPAQGSSAPEYPPSGGINSACSSNLMNVPTSMTDEVRAVQELARQLGGKTVLVNGLGWNDDELAALGSSRDISMAQVESDLLVRASAALMSQNSIPLIFWDADIYNNSSAYYSLTNLQQSLHDAKPLGRVQGQDNAVHEYHFRNGGETTIVAWRALDGDSPVPVILQAGDITALNAWASDSSELTRQTGLHIPVKGDNGVKVMLNERPVLFIGRSGDLIVSFKNSIEDQAEIWQIQLGALAQRWLNEAKNEFVHMLESELDKAKDNALEWGEEQLDELLP